MTKKFFITLIAIAYALISIGALVMSNTHNIDKDEAYKEPTYQKFNSHINEEEAQDVKQEFEMIETTQTEQQQEEKSVIETPQTQTVENKQNVKQEAKEKKSVNKKQEVEQNELEEYSLRDLYTKEDFEIVRQLMIDGIVPEIGTLDENGKEITFKDIESELDSYLDNEERLIQQLND